MTEYDRKDIITVGNRLCPFFICACMTAEGERANHRHRLAEIRTDTFKIKKKGEGNEKKEFRKKNSCADLGGIDGGSIQYCHVGS